ncbi:HPr kinase/phosphorylase [Mesorhizobium sp. INR15]|uniref:HPr kinase/phosphorylase n=1 Tax=Mesorhizobium sp. INR15 TaxID=2654248 RepID=UPI0018966335|nr:hypothetical protein [Mesorhizobium sp. INR15]QPC90586.1 hypothetical protein GA829_08245 [Mesorhizobium sp. INR15]
MRAPDLITDPAALAEQFRTFVAGHGPACRCEARFGDFSVTANFHGFTPQTSYGQALRPVRHAAAPALTIHVFDGEACGLARPRLAWTLPDFGPKRVVPGWSSDNRTVYLLRGENGLAVADWQAKEAFIWMPSSDAVPWYERAAPFRWLFDGLAARLGMATLHAAAVGIDGEGVLLVGRGGVGKSTLALACLGNGFDYVGDDYCLFSQASTPQAHALYSTAKWKKDATVTPAWLNSISPDAVDTTQQKNIVFVDAAKPQSLVDSLRVKAIVIPSIGGTTQARLEAMPQQAALPHVITSTLAQSEAGAAPLVRAVGHLVRSVPAYRLHMTRDPQESVSAIRDLLAKASDAGRVV